VPGPGLSLLPARQILAIDAVGAAVTSLLTALVLAPARLPTGLPPAPLYALALVAAAYCLVGLLTLATRSNPRRTLRVLAVANGSYCLATAALSLIYWRTLTLWAALYFAGEIAIILALVTVESSALKTQSGLETGTSGSTTTSGSPPAQSSSKPGSNPADSSATGSSN
jgi:hypothetical protein